MKNEGNLNDFNSAVIWIQFTLFECSYVLIGLALKFTYSEKIFPTNIMVNNLEHTLQFFLRRRDEKRISKRHRQPKVY